MVLGDSEMYFVYMHKLPNGKVYIGITGKEDPKDRWHNGCGYKNNKRFFNAIIKYGWDNIDHLILAEGLSLEDAEKMEVELIRIYDSSNPLKGYHIAKGGKSNSGFKHSEETKEKIRKTLTGKKHTPERIKNQSIVAKKEWTNPEYRKHMSDVHKGKNMGKDSPSAIRVIKCDMNGNYIREYDAMADAARDTGIDRRLIGDCCKNPNHSAHGYKWKYA